MRNFQKFWVGAIIGAAGVLKYKSHTQFRRDIIAAGKRVKKHGKIAKTHFGNIVYGTLDAGPPVLVIHGAGGGFDQALHVTQIFGHGFQWIAPSRFGYLGSSLPRDPSPEVQADAYAALLDTLDIQSVPIIGISAGGPSAIQFALRYPERCSGLLLVSAVSRAMIDVASNPAVMEKIANWLLASDYLIWVALQLTIHKLIPPMGVSRKVVKQMDSQDNLWLQTLLSYVLPIKTRREGLINDFIQTLKLDIFPLDQIDTPALVVHSTDDTLVSIKHGRYSAKHIPDARIVELPSGGHFLLGQRTSVQTEVESFLRKTITDNP